MILKHFQLLVRQRAILAGGEIAEAERAFCDALEACDGQPRALSQAADLPVMLVPDVDQVSVSPATRLRTSTRAWDMLALSESTTEALAVAAISAPSPPSVYAFAELVGCPEI